MDKEFFFYFKYWGKVKKDVNQDGVDYYLFFYYCLDVVVVCYEWFYVDIKFFVELSNYLGIFRVQFILMMSMFMVMYDFGKFVFVF